MTRPIQAACLAPCLALALAALSAPAAAQQASASFIDAEGNPSGTASLTASTGGVLFVVEVSGLPAGQWVAFHIHEHGTCDPASAHDSAGDHFNPTQTEHGLLTETGPHAGDMPNIWVDESGTARAEVFNPYVTLVEGENSVQGRSLMIHANADDHISQPSGDAGDRLACATIE